MNPSSPIRSIPFLALPLLLGAALVGPVRPARPALRSHVERPSTSPRTFKAGSHLFVARGDGVVIAGLDHALQIGFGGANAVEPRTAQPNGEDTQPLEAVTWPDLWDGISLTYRASATGVVESVYTVAPGADAADIQLAYGTPVSLNADGSLSLHYEAGQLTESAPIAWQVIDGQRLGVDVQFRLLDRFAIDGQGSAVGFTLGAHDPREAVVIDPTLAWNYFEGSSADEYARGIALDDSNNVYVVGDGYRPWGSPIRPWSGSFDAFVVKLNPSGTLVWHTYLGGARNDFGADIVIDSIGSVTVSGSSDATWGNPVRPFSGSGLDFDGFVAQLNPSGILAWNTFLGGPLQDNATGLAVDDSNNVVVLGTSFGTWGSPIIQHSGGNDVSVTRLSGAFGSVMWSTFLGSSATDSGSAAAILGNALYVTGGSDAVWGLPIVGHHGGSDGFLTRLNLSSGAVAWLTFFGGAGSDRPEGIAVDGSGNLFVAGHSDGTWGAPVRTYSGDLDIFAARFTSAGILQWNTFLGGVGWDVGTDVALGAGGSVYVSGDQASWGAPLSSGGGGGVARLSQADGTLQWNTFVADVANSPRSTALVTDASGMVYVAGSAWTGWGNPVSGFRGGIDGYALKLSGAGTPLWHTYIGTGSDESIEDLQVDASGHVYAIGSSSSNATWGGAIHPHSGFTDAMVVKYDPDGTRVWLTFVGGAGNDTGQGLALDKNGNVVICGYSTAAWGSPVRAFGGGYDAYVARLAPDGNLQWTTFLGGAGLDVSAGIEVTANAIGLIGSSLAAWGTPLRAYSSGTDTFVASLNFSGGLIWHTFLGGSGNDSASRLTAASDGTLHLTGQSTASWGTPVRPYAAATDGYVAAISPTGALVWLTFLGGPGEDTTYAVIHDGAGHLFVVGQSSQTWGSPLHPHTIGADGFVARLSDNGLLEWHTFVGGGGITKATDVAVTPAGTLLVTGYSDGSFGTAWQPYGSGNGRDAFLAEMDSSGALVRTAFFGDVGADTATSLAALPSGETVFLGGFSDAAWGDSDEAWFSYAGGLDGFIARVELVDVAPPLLLPFIMK